MFGGVGVLIGLWFVCCWFVCVVVVACGFVVCCGWVLLVRGCFWVFGFARLVWIGIWCRGLSFLVWFCVGTVVALWGLGGWLLVFLFCDRLVWLLLICRICRCVWSVVVFLFFWLLCSVLLLCWIGVVGVRFCFLFCV